MSAHTFLPAVADIAAVFEEECKSRGAATVDCYQDDQRLLARGVFGPALAVRPGDQIQGGVALRAEGPELFVHPFTWRQVCTNGAMASTVLATHRLERLEVDVSVASTVFVGAVLEELRSAIELCANPARLEESVEQMRSATALGGALAINLLTHLLRANDHQRQMILSILDRHAADDDRSAYGVFNAVTSVARDSADPEVRWRLETLGGQLLERLAGERHRLPLETQLVTVGA